ncbi:MAG: hypothetical protein LBE38_02425 [Deltaproteobacteria bacterium]|jgi:ABC-type transporter Mla subunit MlaD|nr:hypothetical protein [Deltaproteobacteria bacterium]
MKIIANFLTSNYFIGIYILFIVYIFTLHTIKLSIQTNTIKKGILKAENSLNNYLGNDKENIKINFYQNLENINNKISENKILKSSWLLFYRSLIFPLVSLQKPTGQMQPNNHKEMMIISCPSNSYSFFNEESIIAQYFETKLFSAIPNILTGFGILGTFIGLAAGIYLAKDNLMNSADIEQMKEPLKYLLGGAGLAFLTSICGILLSITFIFIEKHNTRRLKICIDEWNEKLDSAIQIKSVEMLIAEKTRLSYYNEAEIIKIDREQLIEQNNMHLKMQLFFEHMTSTLPKILTDNNENLINSIHSLREEVTAIRNDRNKDLGTLVKDLINEFVKQLGDLSNEIFKEVTQKLETLTKLLNDSIQNFYETSISLNSAAKNANDAVKEITTSTSSINQATETLQRINLDTLSMSELLKNTVTQSIDDLLTIIQSLIESVNNNQNKQEEFLSKINTLQEENLVKINSQQVALFDKIQERLDAWGDKSQEMINNLKEYEIELMETLKNQLELNNEEYKKYYQLNSEHLESILTKMKSEINEFTEILVHNVNEVNTKLDDSFQNFTIELRNIKNMYQQMEDYSDRLASIWQSYIDKFDRTDGIIENILKKIIDNSNTHITQAAGLFKKIDEAYAKSLNLLTDTIQEMEDTFDNAEHFIYQFNSTINEIKNIDNKGLLHFIESNNLLNQEISGTLSSTNKLLTDKIPVLHDDFIQLHNLIEHLLNQEASGTLHYSNKLLTDKLLDLHTDFNNLHNLIQNLLNKEISGMLHSADKLLTDKLPALHDDFTQLHDLIENLLNNDISGWLDSTNDLLTDKLPVLHDDFTRLHNIIQTLLIEGIKISTKVNLKKGS